MNAEPIKKERMSITVSKKTKEMVSDLKESTDADSDSEVIRNCVRLAYAVLVADKSGSKIFLENTDGEKVVLSVGGGLPAL